MTSMERPDEVAIPPQQQVMRYHHLDVLRAFLMMFGVVLHSCTLGESEIYSAIFYASGLVRMEAFFIISGFVTALIYAKYGAKRTVHKRLVTIGVPLVFGLIILNPFTNYLVYIFHNPAIGLIEYFKKPTGTPSNGPNVWYLHLWFLFPLMLYSLLTPGAFRILEVARALLPNGLKLILRRFDFFVICIIVTASCASLRLFYFFELKSLLEGAPMSFIVREVLYNFPFFVLGIFLFIHKSTMDSFHKLRVAPLAFGLVWLYLSGVSNIVISDELSRLSLLLARAYVAVVLSGLLFHLSSRLIKGEQALVRYFSDASYSVYILHYFTIYVLGNVLVGAFTNQYFLSSVVCVCTLFITILLHHRVIKNNWLLAFLINGKTLR